MSGVASDVSTITRNVAFDDHGILPMTSISPCSSNDDATVSSTGSGSSMPACVESSVERGLGLAVFGGDAVEELFGLGCEQRDLLLLEHHAQARAFLRGLDHEAALARAPKRADRDQVDRIEFDRVRHAPRPPCGRCR